MDTTSSTVLPALCGADEDADWRLRALCAQTDPEAFFPDKGGSAREALAVCRRCEVQAECLTWALENDVRFGVWGGQTERSRRSLRRSARAAVTASAARGGESA